MHNAKLYAWLLKSLPVRLIANRNRRLIPLFLLYACVRVLTLAGKYDVLLLGSGVLGVAGWVAKALTRKPVIAVVHGLDLTYSNPLYQKLWIGTFLPRLDRLIAVGNETIRIGVRKGIPSSRFVFIPNGVDPHELKGRYSRKALERVLGRESAAAKIILTAGRLVRRKGVAWFVENVVPRLPANVMYVVSGSGPDRSNIEKAIRRKGLKNRVRLLGHVSEKTRLVLLNTCDLFVQPNIPVKGDMEGFGISVIEAGACGMAVIASRLEGLADSIKDSQNGILVEPANAQAWTRKVTDVLADEKLRSRLGKRASRYVESHYAWSRIIKEYVAELRNVVEGQSVHRLEGRKST